MYIGIDIAKLKFDIALLDKVNKYHHKSFKNTLAGFADFFVAHSSLSRLKTDKTDAKLIARFCQAMNPPFVYPTSSQCATVASACTSHGVS